MPHRIPAAPRFLSLLAVGLLGCQGPSEEGGIVQIASTKPSLFGLPNEYRALHAALTDLFDAQVLFRSQPDGKAIGEQLRQGQVAYAILAAREYCAINDPGDLTLVASAVNGLGKTTRKGHIVVRANSHVKEITDCQGKRFAFGTYGDLLTDLAAQAALREADVPVKSLLRELVPPPFAFEGRLYRGREVAKTIVADLTVNAGVLDEVAYARMPETGGNFILGPSKDQFKIVGETIPVPEMVVVAGPAADATQTNRLKTYLLNEAEKDRMVCKQLGINGFKPPDPAAYDAVRQLLLKHSSGTRVAKDPQPSEDASRGGSH